MARIGTTPRWSLAAWGADLVGAFFAGRKRTTVDAYRRDLVDFGRFLGVDHREIPRALLDLDQGQANLTAHQYRADLLARGLSPASVNRHLAAVRSLVKMLRTMGRLPYTLDVEPVKGAAYRDTRGPGDDVVRRMVATLAAGRGRAAARDLALVRLLDGVGLRRGEAVGLDLADVDLDARAVWIMGKGRTERERLTMPERTAAAVAAWIITRGQEPGPLFVNFDRAGKGGRLTGRSVARIVARVGATVGAKVRPHGIRHTSITRAVTLTGGDVTAVKAFSRHRDVRTVMVYVDHTRDLQGQLAGMVEV
jgi:integrase/recombinase XerC